ncbi:MAG: hypothetical protein ABSH28_14865 [Acidobacteriota bacterium]
MSSDIRTSWLTTVAARSRNSNDFNYYEVFGRERDGKTDGVEMTTQNGGGEVPES